ncbi:MAG: peptidase M3 [Candidatus Riflebacteria bacterium HGW-Riflebacteria-1]|nr:MAG: peptidase M3 [Candidatus Riflebacteria bacterium HGW-Riflebacteria-1]
MTMISPAQNPLMARSGLPLFEKISAEHVVPAMDATLAEIETRLKEIEASIVPTWDGLCKPLEDLDTPFEYTWGVVNHLISVKNSDDLRKAHQEVMPKVINFSLRMSQSKPIYEGLKKLRASAEYATLNAARQRIIEKKIKAAEHAGVGLEGAAKERFNEIANRISKIGTDFSNNVLDATKAYELIVTNKADTEGWPNNLKQLAAQSWAKEKGEKGQKADSENGPWRITLDYPSSGPFVQHSRNREHRREVYHQTVTRASSGNFDNSGIIEELLRLRREQAQILGFKTFAELSLDNKMAPDVAAVEKMFSELEAAARSFAEKELKDLQKIAAESGQTDQLRHWDTPFWAERLREKLYDFTDDQLRPYFPLPRVLDGLFSLAERIFGISITKSNDKNVPRWHEEVDFFDIKDDKGKMLAHFYLDPYSRPAEKRGGAWMNECFGRRIIDGAVRLPVIYLVCNGTPPVEGKPSLMSFNEVSTLFHEFGHGIQGMLTVIDEAEAAGINGVEWDAVELASQFMENWCYNRPTLLGMARHYETGENLPEDLFEKIKASKNFRAGSVMLRQIEFGRIDIHLHHYFDLNGKETPFEAARRIATQTSVMPPYEHERFLCSFSHIFAGGYAAGYYSYKWAEVLSSDAFAAFEEAGFDNENAIRELGRKYRDTVLALGGSKHPTEVYRMFRGRDATTAALLRHSGLAS